ncbi:monovalent cation/H(+) antiporter subunit G [Tianweitania sp. BSSL-BM11]|uniref:Monovalent cation/H(+) antiporter subunit G n=1 Tax=Tianweitania aestuarii TaxID=2814886 RepID=A0ABS5RS39_9HYPH|nr:monovalent cation/H(+) antiporter subunit G [Tianweitania aestuarii]MBS9719863.1 monovalent cation/H(+) antiporter subunit G [Tianweitania aestuarii]
MIEIISNTVAAILLLVGSIFTLTAAIGLLRLPDVYSRMHAASKVGTLGSCVILLALAVVEADLTVATRVVAAITFFIITAPISAHLLARAALTAGYPLWEGSVRNETDKMTDIVRPRRADADE